MNGIHEVRGSIPLISTKVTASRSLMRRRLVIAVLVATGCEDERSCVVVEVPFASFAMYREADGPWQTLVLTDGTGEMCVEQEYVVTAVCDVPLASQLFVLQHRGTPEDDARVRLDPCFEKRSGEVTATGLMAQPGGITFGPSIDQSLTPSWSFDLHLKPGVYDLIATDLILGSGGGSRVAIRRGVGIDTDTTLSAIDLEAEGVQTVDVSMIVNGASSDETVSTGVFLETPSTSAIVSGQSGMMARVIPESALIETDAQYVSASARTDVTSRSVLVDVRQLEALDLPPRLDDIAFADSDAGLVASWNELPSELDRVALDSFTLEHVVFLTATKRWIELTGATTLGLDPSAPGFDPGWILRGVDALSSGFQNQPTHGKDLIGDVSSLPSMKLRLQEAKSD